MKKLSLLLLAITLSLFAQSDSTAASGNDNGEKMSGSIVAGATTINGQNYQQLGFRADIPLGKFGFGLDVQLLIDADGQIRKEDWDQVEDYFDKIYYLRYGKKGEPFYMRVGGLDNSTLGYGIAMNGYSNMVQYPNVKRLGMESSFETENLGAEIVINNFKEMLQDQPGMLIGARGFYKVWGDLRVGAGVVADLNEFNGLTDTDGDGYSDRMDYYPNDGDLVTKRDYIVRELTRQNYNLTQIHDIVQAMIAIGEMDSLTADSLAQYGDSTSTSAMVTFDVGYPLIKGDLFSLDVYGQAAQIIDYGFGFAAPAAVAKMGPLTLRAEYRHSGKEFLFNFYDQTYELQRATFINNGGKLLAYTKKDMLKGLEPMNGFFAGASFNAFGFLTLGLDYQQMSGDSTDIKSIRGELAINAEKIPKLSKAKAYYIQNNVEDFSTWKSEGAILGYVIGYKVSEGVSLDFNYRYNFEDRNGDGKIKGSDETIKTIGITTTMIF